jgi:putative selenium metabolism hydrolase
MLNSHLDTVPPGDLDSWEHDPYGGEIEDGKIFGRGAVDIKSGTAATVYAMKILQDLRDTQGIRLPGDIIFSAVMDEENATCFGADYLMKTTLPEAGLDVDVTFLSEPTNGCVLLGHRGKVELVVTTKGVTAHSSTPSKGINAVEKMVPVLQDVFDRQQDMLRERTHPKLGHSTVTVTNILARPGALSIVPDGCEISLDRRYVPGENLETIMRELEELFEKLAARDPDFKATVEPRTFHEVSWTGYEEDCLKHHDVWVVEPDNSYVVKTIEALKGLGQPAEIGYWSFGTDGSAIAGRMGIPCIGFSWAREEQAHRYDENITIKELVDTTEGYVAILCKLFDIGCGVLDE